MTEAYGARPRAQGSGRERAILAAVQLVLLAPFLDKAVHIDDAFFLAIARHISSAPFDPYGFDYNWAGTPAPVWEEIKNPPGVFYFQALLLRLAGEGERWLHAAFALFALSASQATYELARRVTQRPLYPALLLVVCPAYWVSATSLMVDMPLIAAMLLALLALVVAHEREQLVPSVAAGVAASAAVLAKYFGLALVPLMAALVWLQRGRRSLRLGDAIAIGMPLLAFAAWWGLSGGHFTQASGYRAEERGDVVGWLVTHGLSAATFSAGLLGFPVALLAGSLASARSRGIGLIALGVGIGVALVQFLLWPDLAFANHALAGVLVASFGVFAFQSFASPPKDPLRRTLLLWLAGSLVFALVLNWTLNARTILLLAPPAVLVFAWQSEGRRVLRGAALVLTGVLGVVVVAADDELAEFGRAEAARIQDEHVGKRVLFAGHWGFQYYMEAAGYSHVDLAQPRLGSGDIVLAPVMHQVANGGIDGLTPLWRGTSLRPRVLPIAVMDAENGAGLHGSFLGPLPFAFSSGPLERVEMLRW